jgi:hypothetical protein
MDVYESMYAKENLLNKASRLCIYSIVMSSCDFICEGWFYELNIFMLIANK